MYCDNITAVVITPFTGAHLSITKEQYNNINLLSLTVVRRDGSITPFKSDKISYAIKLIFENSAFDEEKGTR